jgi:hypothetical protein
MRTTLAVETEFEFSQLEAKPQSKLEGNCAPCPVQMCTVKMLKIVRSQMVSNAEPSSVDHE